MEVLAPPLDPVDDPFDDASPGDADVDDRPLARLGRWWGSLDTMARWAVAIDAAVLVAATLFVLAQLGPRLLIADTTPAGGDMGAHVWGPAYLRDHLLPHGRLTGWTPDWYAGFPAYHFYMVLPALGILALDNGWSGWAALVPFAAAVSLAYVSFASHRQRSRRAAAVAAIAVAVLGIGLPYGVAFKLVTVLGLLALPAACYLAGRLADVPFPGPPLLAIGSVVFLFNREPKLNGTGNIIGGNVVSTLAGEFSFSLSLLFCVLYVGFLLRGLRTGGYRATCAALLALTALCHIIPAIYAVGATVVALAVSMPLDRKRLTWFLPIGPVALAVTAFWTLPFAARRAYLNDMGWEKIPAGIADVPLKDFLWNVWTQDRYATFGKAMVDVLFPGSLRWVLVLALVGAVVSVVLRIRLGILLTLCTFGTLVAFVLAPQGRLWNARILPFYVLCLCLLAAVGIAELGRAVASLATRRPDRPIGAVALGTPVAAALATFAIVAIPLGVFPGTARNGNGERWSHAGITIDVPDRNIARDWARWNYSGYERKAAYPEYYGLIRMAERIASRPDEGCGRVMWEYDNDRLNPYGTPMAPMLLPFWTDGCMGSMEGLYFEASATTPYHFLTQKALSARCSCAQRDIPYGAGFDIDLGIQQLQRQGVRYYFAFSDQAVAAADAHPDLTAIDTSGPWHAYQVADSDLVEPLRFQPAVLTGVEPGMSWVGPATKWWQDPSRWDVALAEDGPDDWERIPARTEPADPKAGAGRADDPTWTRIDASRTPRRVRLPEVEVRNVVVDDDRISFDVSEPGVPVLVKTSYFPNWQASGADGPYRVTPNHMVVVPTGTHVELHYGWTGVDRGSYALSGLGLVGLVLLFLRPARRPDGDDGVWLDGPDPLLPPPVADDVDVWGEADDVEPDDDDDGDTDGAHSDEADEADALASAEPPAVPPLPSLPPLPDVPPLPPPRDETE